MQKHEIILLIFLLVATLGLFGESRTIPDWNVQVSDYEFNANIIARILVNNEPDSDLSNILAAFYGDECRGVVSPIQFGSEALYFLTVYGNQNGDELSFKFYQADSDLVVDLEENIIFEANQIYGSVLEPVEMHCYVNYDNPPQVNDIPDQTVCYQDEFSNITLSDYLLEFDGEEVIWTVSGNENLEVNITGNNAEIIRQDPQWTGSETIIFVATDQTDNALSDSDSAIFTVLPLDHAPIVEDIPDQTVSIDQEFDLIDLDNYLEEVDGDPIIWSYEFLDNDTPEPFPDWEINSADYELTMSLTIQVISEGDQTSGDVDLLAAFCGDECRGVCYAQQAMGSWFYFLTIYADYSGEEINFRFYNSAKEKEMPVAEEIQFIANGVIGNPLEPWVLHAGNLMINISDDNYAAVSIVEDNWFGSESIIFTATDQNTSAGYCDSDEVIFTVLEDHVPQILPVDDQIITVGDEFEPIFLDDHLIELDGDEVVWSISEVEFLNVNIGIDNVAEISVVSSDWLGTESVTFTVTDITDFSASSSIEVDFTVMGIDHEPVISDIPDQIIASGMQFTSIQLNDYLTEIDGDQIEWSYQFPAEDIPEALPDWEINPGNYEFSINLTIEIMSEGQAVENDSNFLYAICQDECRGIATAINTLDKWLYFLTVYANTNGEEISFQFYDAAKGRLLPVQEQVVFFNNQIYGDPVNPVQLQAGRLSVTINPDSEAYFSIIGSDWTGECLLHFIARDVSTINQYSDFDEVLFTVIEDHAPQILPIDDQFIFINQDFPSLDLDDHLIEIDGDPVIWNFYGENFLQINIDDDNIVMVSPVSGDWTGSETITYLVSDDTDFAAWDTTEVTYTVLPEDHAPVVSGIPDQVIAPGEDFQNYELAQYLTELDGDEIRWNCEVMASDQIQPFPEWEVNPADYQYTMTLTGVVFSKSASAEGEQHLLAAFAGEQCRGVANAIYTLDQWYYFLTIYANQDDEEITFRFYDNEFQQTLPVLESICFESNLVVGNPLEPFQLTAGYLSIRLNEDIAIVNIIDPDWSGCEIVNFMATDLGTMQQLSGFDQVMLSVSNNPQFILPDSLTFAAHDSLQTDFSQYLFNADPQDLILSVSGNQMVDVEIDGFSVTFCAIDNWSGSETITFYVDDQRGRLTISDSVEVIVTPPQIVTVSKEFLYGWNWFSINVSQENMGINDVLSSIGNCGSSIKNQTTSSLYYDGAGWFGSMNQMNNTSLYKLYCDQSALWEYSGIPVDIQETVYDLNYGWNWISFAPQEVQEINFAFSDLESATTAKNQFQSAMYYPGAGWFGSLQYLQPLNGYMLYLDTDEEFVYPQPQRGNINSGKNVQQKEIVYLDANPADYEYNAVLIASSDMPFTEGSHLVAKCGEQVRSICQILDYTEQFGKIFYSLMLYSYQEYEEGFQLFYQGSTDSKSLKVFPEFSFQADMIMGDFIKPLIIDQQYGMDDSMLKYGDKLSVYPNPFNPQANIRFWLEEEGCLEVNIYNIKGQKVKTINEENMMSGHHSLIWNGMNQFGKPCASGIYLFQLKTREKTENYRALLLK